MEVAATDRLAATLQRIQSSGDQEKGEPGTPEPPSEERSTQDNAGANAGEYPQTFSEIAELIASGKTDGIPNTRDIPLEINPDPPSESTMERPRKPWET
ncbi:hypothetical protein MCUN1_001569 [Malassezia cuniculi]|uniref:Peroxisomal membrane protein PEX14-like KPWE domain-containing protein n=1 Tax=Malassezia cuniculi TaxID=948313 RepID=A0AAF0J650_9BASI|nr:hypothetical protein MCUN1_001569 [Malassezia cuniculi]